MSKVRGWRRFTAGAILMAVLGSAGTGWAQLPIKDIVVPVITNTGAVMLNVNPSTLPPGYQRPVQKQFDLFGLLPPTLSGTCAQVTTTYIAVTDGYGQFRVFTYKQGYVPPSDVVAGRSVKIIYKQLDNGLLQATGIRALDMRKMPVSGAQVGNDTTSADNTGADHSVPNINTKAVNGGP